MVNVSNKTLWVDEQLAEEAEEEQVELTIGNLGSLEAVFELGRQAASMLQSFGSASFLIDEQHQIRLANPLMVYFDGSLAHPPDGVDPVFVRPVLTAGRPQFVAKKPDGSLWEVEYPLPIEQEEEDARDN